MGTAKVKCLKNLYIGPKAQKVQDQIYRAVSRGTMLPGLYLITFASNDIDQLNILSSRYLLKKEVRDHLPIIAGFAIGRSEALETVASMAHDAYMQTGGCDLQKYLLAIQKDGD